MSNSVFKIYPPSPTSSREEEGVLNVEGETSGGPGVLNASSADERLKIDSNLVIVVGKDGSVHVDQHTLHSLLANETKDTSVSVVRITSPTPSIEAEIEEDRRLMQEQKLQQELESGTGSSDSGSGDSPDSSNAAPSGGVSKNETPANASAAGPSGVSTRRSNKHAAGNKKDVMLDDGEVPHVSMMVEAFYPPEEAKKFAEEVLTLAGLRKPLRVDTRIDYEFQRYVIANDHCYTPLTSPSQKLPPRPFYEDLDSPIEIRSGDGTAIGETHTTNQHPPGEGTSGRKRSTSKILPSTPTSKSRRRKSARETINDAEDLQSILEDTDSDYSEDSSYPEEDDNDSDLDFSITGKTPKKRKSSSQNKTPKSVSKKEESHESSKKKSTKTPKKSEPKTPVSMLNKTGIPRTYGPKRNLQPHMSGSASPAPSPVVSTSVTAAVTAVTVPTSVPVTVVTVVKKDIKKPPKPAHHVEALFSDMTSLFSTPDIIKKVGSGRLGQHVGTPTTTPVITPSTSNAVRGFVQLSPAIVKGPQKLPAHISIQTHTSASEEHDKRLDLIDSIVQQELNHPDPKLPLQQPTMTEDIVKMLENNLPPGGVQEPVLPITDNSILAALGSNDDGLPEDLLQHVAELAEHKELQEILDKQVLGVIGTGNSITESAVSIPTPSSSTMNQISITQQMQPSTPTLSTSSSANPESLPTMTVKEQLMPRKEAIQIRRSDGRIITLPPIEAPATRSAKRRAQAGSSSSVSTPPVSAASHTTTVPSASSSPSSAAPHTKYSKQSSKVSTGAVSYDDGSGSLMIDETRSKASRSGTSSRRTSESSSTSGRGKRQSTVAVAAAVVTAVEDDAESDESWNSEDDPDRLWCICMQPHNNRFMICCDTCEEWFHGKCVNVTKVMGQQMEEDGVEWSCPNCSKKKQEKQQPKMTEFLISSSSSSVSIGETFTTAPSTPPKVVALSMAGCVVCSKPSRTSSVYCSDECIRKHAGMANSSVATTTPLFSTATSPAHGSTSSAAKDKQNEHIAKKYEPLVMPKGNAKAGPIIVMERKTGRCLTGKNAPTAENLKAWLLSNPSFEVVPPGSPQEAIILAKQAEVRKQQMANEAQKKTTPVPTGARQTPTAGQLGSKVQSQIKITDQKKLTLASPARQQHGQHSKPPMRTFSRISVGTPTSKAITYGNKSATITSKVSPHSSGSSTPNTSSSSEHVGKHQRKTSSESKIAPKHPAVPAGENIRVTVKKTLKEHLAQRTSEMIDKGAARLTNEEIEKFVAEIEEEMFALFNKDTGAKYRAKYRSLVFNIKDRKNLSLFQKICEKRIEAKQLVRMTPEELASQELAQWRENENKHQLEMIKKSELDLLACAKNYVLKTHKGEEVIEGKRDDRLQLDPSTSVEDVVAILNNSTVSSTSEVESTLSPSKDNYRKDYDFHGKYSTGLYSSGPITSSTLAGSSAAAAGSSSAPYSSTATSSFTIKKKESRRSRSRSRSHDRHKDRSRSRSKHKRRRSRSHDRLSSRSRERDRHHREHKSDHHKSDYKSEHKSEHHKSEHHHKKREARDSKEKSVSDRPKEIEAFSSVSSEKDKNEAVGKSIEAGKQPKKVDSKPQILESFNLVDQILASAGSSGGKTEEPTEKGDKAVQEESKPSVSTDQDQEPTSTVTIPTPPHSTSFDTESPTNDFTSTDSSNLSDDARKKAMFVHWTGNVHMIDVASVEMSIRSVSGDVDDVMKEFPDDLNICGTIKPEIVWDYIGQIKKSINKEICLVRFHSNESAAYYTLYSHLFSRKRYSVVKSPTSAVKDFYIFPLPSGQMVPMILKPLRGMGIIEGDKKPDLLLGIIVKVKGMRSGTTSSSGGTTSPKNPRRQTKATASTSGSSAVSPAFALMQQVITKYATVNKKVVVTNPETAVGSTPPSSPGPVPPSTAIATVAPSASSTEPKISRTMSESSDHVDVDMDIIKAPVAPKAATVKEPIAAVVIDDDDDDEPYSPGGDSNDSDHFADVTAIVETKNSSMVSESDRIRREMDEINRKIAEEKNEIVGIINKAELKEDEIKSTLDPSLITDIAIPSNLSEILASIKSTPSSGSDSLKGKEVIKSTPSAPVPIADDEEEYVPTSIYSSYKSGYGYGASKSQPNSEPMKSLTESGSSNRTSRLANLSEAELLSMVPDDSYLQSSSTSKSATPVVELDSDDSISPPKKSKWISSEPPPPGLEDDMDIE